MRIRSFNAPVYAYSKSATAHAFANHMAEGDDAGDKGAGGDGDAGKAGGSDGGGGGGQSDAEKKAAELKAENERMAAELAKLRDKDKAKSEEEKKAEAKAKAEKAIADGKAKQEIERLQAERDELEAKLRAGEKKARERLDAQIEKLSEDDRKEIDAIKDHLPVDTLTELVAIKSGRSTSTDDTEDKGGGQGGGSLNPGGGIMPKERKFSNKATDILGRLGVDVSVAKKTERQISPNNPLATKDVFPIDKLIEQNKSMAPPTVRLSKEEARKRRGE